MATAIRLRCSGRDVQLRLDLSSWSAFTLRQLRAATGEGVRQWCGRIGELLERGASIVEIADRETDVTAMIFLAEAQRDPSVTWDEVERSIAPYTLQIDEVVDVPPAAPAPPAAAAPVVVDPDGHRDLPSPFVRSDAPLPEQPTESSATS